MSRKKKLIIVLIIILLISVLSFVSYNLLIVYPIKKEIKSLSLHFLEIDQFHIPSEYLDENKSLSESNRNILVQNFEKELKKVMISTSSIYETELKSYIKYLETYQNQPYVLDDIRIKFKDITNFKLIGDSADIEITYTIIEVVNSYESKFEKICSFHFEKVNNKWMITEYYMNYTNM